MRIVAVDHSLPSREVSNEDLIQRILARYPRGGEGAALDDFERAVRAYFARTGAGRRWHRAPGERALDLGVAAARGALARAGWDAGDVDLLLYVGVGRGCLEPATANIFHQALGLARATCFDILDACASWLRAFDVARHMLHAGTVKRVMILNCEFNFEEYIRWDFRGPDDLSWLGAGFTVGEAATATLLEDRGEDEYHLSFRTRGDLHHLCQIPLPNAGQFGLAAGSDGSPRAGFFAHATELNTSAIAMLEQQYRGDPLLAGWTADVIVGHSTSVPSRDSVAKRLGLDTSRMVDTFEEHGNTVSASLPLGLSIAARDGRLERGHRVLLMVGSAGVSTGVCRFRY